MTEMGRGVQEGGKTAWRPRVQHGDPPGRRGTDHGGATGRPLIATHRLATGRGLPGQGPGQTLPAHAARLGDLYLDLPRFRLLRLGQMQG